MKHLTMTAVSIFFLLSMTGCLLTKIVTVPMRVTGAVVSIVPVVGNTADAAIDTAADIIDDVPI